MFKRAKKVNKEPNLNFRFNMLTVIVYIIGMILIIQLFNLQIVHGAEYKEVSNTRLTRETTLEAARGAILDRSGNELVTTKTKFGLELYKTKIDNDELNNSILNIVNLLEKYEVTYKDSFPIKVDPIEYTLEGDELAEWKEDLNLDEDISAEEAFEKFKSRYKIITEDNTEARKIISIRYKITIDGYSSTKALKIADDIPREAVSEFSESSDKFPGVNIIIEPEREYTSGTLASHILGYAGTISATEYETRKDTYDSDDLIGKTGIEYVFEEYLRGQNGTKQIDMAVDGTITAEYISEEAVAGSDVVLTIDSQLQQITETALKENIEKIRNGGFGTAYDANAGACVVMNVNTGEILAMASYPDYNPADFVGGISSEKWAEYVNNEYKPLINRAIQNSYSPGSTFKMITAIAGLETGTINLNTKINDTGVYNKYSDSIKKCWYYSDYGTGHGWLNVSQAIEKSCNYFFFDTSDKMGISQLVKYAKYFGLGTKTGVELQSETAGVLASPETKEKLHQDEKTWGAGDTLNASIGQGDNEFTPLQMAKYISMLANGGKKIDVSIVKTIRRADGTEVSKSEINEFVNQKLGLTETEEEDITLNQDYLNAILEGMKSVTSDEGGTAYSRFVDFDIELGGKTGSAEAPNNQVHAWFVGFAPYDNPEIAIVVMVENGGHGNYTAEVVRNIMQEYFGMNTQDVDENLAAVSFTESIN